MENFLTKWSDIKMQHLFFAYRKAKADCFFNRQLFVAEKFVEFEKELHRNLENIMFQLQRGEIEKILNENLGTPTLAAKKLSLNKKNNLESGHSYFSSPFRAFEHISTCNKIIPEFRLIGNFPVTTYIISALWMNEVGHKFDEKLSKSAYASRLRRYQSLPGTPKNKPGSFHKLGLGSFIPYFTPYKNWRRDGLNAIRNELEEGRSIIAMSLDLKNYYHNIDPNFIGLPGFWEELQINLNNWEKDFTRSFSKAMAKWSDLVQEKISQHTSDATAPDTGGVPMGLPAIRLLANALLYKLDKAILEGLAPIYYGRYVDDIFLVMHDPGSITSLKEIMNYIKCRIPFLTDCESIEDKGFHERRIELGESYQGKTKLILQEEKNKIFFLNPEGGLDLLDNIEKEIISVASERRLMPDPDTLDKTTSAKVLSAASNSAEEADTLRRADGLSVKRLGWSIQLRSVETLARDLKSEDWKEQRYNFYTFAKNHVLRPDKVLDQLDYLPRLLSLSVSLEDWVPAIELVQTCKDAILQIQKSTKEVKINGFLAKKNIKSLWVEFENQINFSCQETFLRAYRWRKHDPVPFTVNTKRLMHLINLSEPFFNIKTRALALRESDWAKTPYKDHLKRDAQLARSKIPNEETIAAQYEWQIQLESFLNACEQESEKKIYEQSFSQPCVKRVGDKINPHNESLIPYLFPTRPYLAQEIALYLPECLFNDCLWARYVHAIRGSWVIPHLIEEDQNISPIQTTSNSLLLSIGKELKTDNIRLGISSLKTTAETWAKSANGPQADLAPSRYKHLTEIINQALKIQPRPTHILLPELALPERWIDSISSRLKEAKINLIAGLDYHHHPENLIESSAVIILSDDRLGFSSPVQIRQRKESPAPQEGHDLFEVYGKTWHGHPSSFKRIYSHHGFHFGVLICSELQNIRYRQHFQGSVDALMVLAWNKDLETFSSLIESAALDVHTYVALVNNREYGDSRVRSPAKDSFKRDLCRLKGGGNDYFVVVEIDINSLRAFQSRAKPWPRLKEDQFKPVPEGFNILESRKIKPK